jgi:hypothetical protein
MRRAHRLVFATAAASIAALFAATTIAEAKTRHVRAAPARPLTVKKRPFTDSGTMVPVGSESRYVYDTQYYGGMGDPTYYGTPGSYGAETLPRRFEIPRQPLFNF